MYTFEILKTINTISVKNQNTRLTPTKKPANVKKFKDTNSLIKHLNTAEWNPLSFSKEEYRKACLFFKYTNYYYFSVYRKQLPRRENRKYKYSEAIVLYDFDQWLREEISKFTGTIEIMLRSTLIRELGNKYDGKLEKAELYLDPIIYNSRKSYLETLPFIEKRIDESKSEPVKHHRENKDYSIPIWVLMDELTFGELCRFVESLDIEYRNYWLENAFTKEKQMKKKIFSWFRAAWYMRNTCAHYSRIYGRYFTVARPSYMTKERRIAGKSGDDNQDLFANLLAFKHLISFNNINKRNRWNYFIAEVDKKIKSNPELILLDKMGFPENWREILFI